jgi:hypothetical protein
MERAGQDPRAGLTGALALALALAACAPAAGAAGTHREAVLRLVAISSALREEARALQEEGMLALDDRSRMAGSDCAQFFQDLVSMRNVRAVSAGAEDLVVRWLGERELLLRLQPRPGFELQVHDSSGGSPACVVRSLVGSSQGKVTPVLLDVPGLKRGPARVFAVDPVRSPSKEPLR